MEFFALSFLNANAQLFAGNEGFSLCLVKLLENHLCFLEVVSRKMFLGDTFENILEVLLKKKETIKI